MFFTREFQIRKNCIFQWRPSKAKIHIFNLNADGNVSFNLILIWFQQILEALGKWGNIPAPKFTFSLYILMEMCILICFHQISGRFGKREKIPGPKCTFSLQILMEMWILIWFFWDYFFKPDFSYFSDFFRLLFQTRFFFHIPNPIFSEIYYF